MISKSIKEVAKEVCTGWFVILSPLILLVTLLVALFFLQNCSHDKFISKATHTRALAKVIFIENKKPECKEKIEQIRSQRNKMADELDKIKSILKKKEKRKTSNS